MDARVIRPSATARFWQALARALLPPMRDEETSVVVNELPDELDALSAVLGLEAEQELSALRAGLRGCAQPQALLLQYARLFLPPAGFATLNLSRYVDSAGGPCMDAIEAAYLAQGLAPGDGLRDLPDHAARQCEFMAYLAASSPGDEDAFAQLCLSGAVPRLAGLLAQRAPDSPYTALVALAARALRATTAAATQAPPRPNRRHDRSLGVWRHCAGCDQPYAREKEIAIMTAALARAGLPASHLALCPNCRDRAQGFFRREIA